MHNISFSIASSDQIEDQLGERIEALRLSQNITQNELAKRAGVSRSTIVRLATPGKGISLDSFIRVLQALGVHQNLANLLPDPSISPIRLLEQKGHTRKRASSSRQKSEWTWGDN